MSSLNPPIWTGVCLSRLRFRGRAYRHNLRERFPRGPAQPGTPGFTRPARRACPSVTDTTTTDTAKKTLGLVGWVAVSFAAAAIATLLQGQQVSEQYASLPTPAWAPPSWVFAPVWTVLYALMGIAAWRVWKANGFSGASVALGLFFAQLVANALWTPLFFGAGLLGWALVDIVVLDLLLVATIVAFWRIDRPAGLLLVPYLLWVIFATALNPAIAIAA
jgi:translocator protein